MKIFSAFLLCCFFCAASLAADFSVTSEQLVAEINIRKTKVLEFQQLHDYGKEHGIRIWVAGGSAAGLAHYVKDDLENEFLKSQGKEPIYFEGRFGYNYFDIYRSTQDCDVIINGDEAQAQELEAFIREKFGHLQGSKEVFEVRLLDKPRGSGAGQKDALINNPDFLDQHTDSHSTGMVELTQPPVEESAVRDLFDWNNQKNHKFISDVIDNQLSYYFSDKHQITKRFKEGINPPILSVLRYYTKLFQYGLKPRPEDEKYLIKFINEFNPQDSAWNGSYVNKQINKNGIKMIRHAQNMEFAINTIERVGLKEKLLEFVAQGMEQVSLWVNKEPLRSYPLASKPGRTAKELGITIVAHETKDFLAYESITMSRRGVPNVFISRSGFDGESARYGDGFYTKMGMEGAHGTGLTIRYTVNPDAVEGVDFFYVPGNEFVIFQNSNVLKVIDESIELAPVDYFKILFQQGMNDSDRGIWKKIELKVKWKMANISEDDLAQIINMVKAEIEKSEPKWLSLERWFALEESLNYPEIIDQLLKKENFRQGIITSVLSHDIWIKNSRSMDMVQYILETPSDSIVKALLQNVLNHPHWVTYPKIDEVFMEIIKRYPGQVFIYYDVFRLPHWAGSSEGIAVIRKMFENLRKYSIEEFHAMHIYIFTQPHWINHPDGEGVKMLKDLWTSAMSVHTRYHDFLHHLFTTPGWEKHSFFRDIVEEVVFKTQVVSYQDMIDIFHKTPHWRDSPYGMEILKRMILDAKTDPKVLNAAERLLKEYSEERGCSTRLR